MIKNGLFLFSICVFFSVIGKAQTISILQPISWDKGLSELSDFYTLPAVNHEEEIRTDSIQSAQNSLDSRRFGVEQSVSLNLFENGETTPLENGDQITRFGVHCPEAISIHLLFSEFELANGTLLTLYDPQKSAFVGAYSSNNNNSANVLGTELLKSEKIILELYEPHHAIGKSQLTIGTVVHGYRDIDQLFLEDMTRNLNGSGNCNIDVNCPQGEGWEQQRNSVARIVIGGSYCTGSLLDNTSDEFIPYVLSANHCLFNAPNPGVWVYRFRWEAPYDGVSCASTSPSTNGTTQYSINGSEIRASNSNADFLLLELFQAPEITWGIYYSGWDNSDIEQVTRATSIHHPRGDLKKIAHSEIAPTHDEILFNGNPNTRVWRVPSWTEGVTEQASSGAPLFDQNKRVIGVLAGGTAACAGTINNGGFDVFGRFGTAWDQNPEPDKQLKFWLDPIGSDTTAIDGRDPNSAEFDNDAELLTVERLDKVICGDSAFPRITFANRGELPLTSLKIELTYNTIDLNPIEWTGNINTGFIASLWLPAFPTVPGENTIKIKLTQPNGVTDENPNHNEQEILFLSASQGEYINMELRLDCFADETSWKIIDDAENVWFQNEEYINVGNASQHIFESFCLAEGCYSFVLEDSFGDGMAGATRENCNYNGSLQLTRNTNDEEILLLPSHESDFGFNVSLDFCAENTADINHFKLDTFIVDLYPNPSNGQVSIKVNNPNSSSTDYQTRIYDTQGRLMHSEKFMDETQLSLSHLAKGSYHIHIHYYDHLLGIKKLVLN